MSVDADGVHHESVHTNGCQDKHNSPLYMSISHGCLTCKG